MAEIRGAGETFVRSSKDGTMQPVGVYVSTTYSPQRPASLVVFLHGWMQPESRLVAPEYLRQIADANGSIVVAPYGRGYYDFNGSASDVYDAAAAATSAFTIDSHRRYLAGYSMGGYSVYNVGPMRPHDWTAVMSVAGSLLGSRGPRLLASMPSTRFYVLTGAHDDIVPTAFPTATAIYLRDAGVPVSFYSARTERTRSTRCARFSRRPGAIWSAGPSGRPPGSPERPTCLKPCRRRAQSARRSPCYQGKCGTSEASKGGTVGDAGLLMERVRARDADAFETLYDEYHRLVYGLALRVLSDQAAAEDVTQAVFLKIWGRPGVVPGRQFPADGSRASPVTARTTCCGAARCTARASSPSRFPPTTRWKTKRWRT